MIDGELNTFRGAIAAAGRALEAAGVQNARLDAELLMAAACGSSRTQLFLEADRAVPEPALQTFQQLLDRRCRREPLQYILGAREFWSLEFLVTPEVLIPRPETEMVIDAVLAIARSHPRRQRILDVGTGSGCVAVILARELADAEIVAVDCSAAALEVARANAVRHDVADRIRFVEGDLLTSVAPGEVDIVAANPPYVASAAELEPELGWEPREALFAGDDGLAVLRRLIPQAAEKLCPAGWLVSEIGYDQGEAVRQLCPPERWQQVEVRADGQGHPRVLVARTVG